QEDRQDERELDQGLSGRTGAVAVQTGWAAHQTLVRVMVLDWPAEFVTLSVTVWSLLLLNPNGAGFWAFELVCAASVSLNVQSQSVIGQTAALLVVEASRNV